MLISMYRLLENYMYKLTVEANIYTTSSPLNRVGTVNIPPPDLRKSHRRIGIVSLDESRISLSATARPGTVTIKPMHPQARIIPDTEHRHHAPPQSLAHTLQPTQRLERPRRRAESLRHGDGRIADHHTLLHVQPADLGQSSCRGVIGRHELRDDGYRLGGVNGETVAIVILCAELVGVVGAAIPVADGVAFGAGARVQAGCGARVRGENCGARVGLPEVHLLAAGTCAEGVGLAVDPGTGVEALRVAVACAVGCTSGVEGAAAA